MSYLREKQLTVLSILVIKALNPLERNTSIFMFMRESILTVCFNSTAGSISSWERLVSWERLEYDCVPGYRIGMMRCLVSSWHCCDLDFHCNDFYLLCGRSVFYGIWLC